MFHFNALQGKKNEKNLFTVIISGLWSELRCR